MNDEFKIKAVIEWEVDEKQLQDTWKKAGEIVWKSIPDQKIKLKIEKREAEEDLRVAKKNLDELVKKNWSLDLKYRAQLEIDEFETTIKEIDTQLEDLSNKVKKGFDVNAIWHLLNSWFFQKIWDWVVSLWKKVLDLGNQAQQAQVSFSTMLWDSEKAKDMIKDLSEFAAKTPFELSWVRDSAKQLLAMWVQAEDMIPTLKSLWDVSAGLNVPLERLALNYWQVLTQWKLTGRELKDFTTAWVPLLDELSKNLNKSKTEIQDLISKWKVSADDVVKAFRTMTSEWWRFANLMEAQSKTLWWLLSNLNDEINLTWEAIGTQLVPWASKFVEVLQNIMWWIRERVQENPNLTQWIVAFVWAVWGAVAWLWALAWLIALISAWFWALALPVVWVVAWLWVLVWTIVYLNWVIEETKINTEFMWETYESLTQKIKENEEALADLKKQLDDWVISIEEYEKKKEELEEREWKLKKALDNTYMSLNDVNTELENLSNQQISNTEKLKRLQEIKDKAFSTMKTVEQLKLSLASLDWKLATLVDTWKNWVNFNPFTKSWREQFKLWTKLLWKKVGSWFWLSESPEDYLKWIYTEKEALEERIENYDDYKNKEAEIDKQIADLEVEIEKEKLKELNKLWWWSGWSGSSSKNEINDKKKELKEKRDLMIKDVENSVSSEEEKYEKILEINDRYKNELAELEWKTTDNVIKNAEKQLKAIEEKNKKEWSYYEDLEKVQDKIDDSIEKYKDNVKKVWDEWEKVKEKAQDSIREVNNAIEQLDKDYAKDTAERLNKVQEWIKEFERKNWSSEWLKWYSIDMLENRDSDEISWIKVKDAIEYLRLLEEQKWLNENISDDIKAQAENIKEISESQQKAIEYEEKRNALIEKRKMLEAVSNSTLENPWLRYKEWEDDIVQYFDTEEQEWKDIKDFKNNEQAIDILNNKTTLDQKLIDLKQAHEDELKAYWNQVIEIKKKYESDTKNYKDELAKKKEAFAQYVKDVNELASQLSSSASTHNAYWWSLLSGNASRVGENGPEQIIARQSSYVQPRNAVNNNSTVYNNQSSYSINWMNIEVNNVDEFLNELKNRLTYRN